MDTISILDIAGSILALEEFSAALILDSDAFEQEPSLDGKDGDFILERIRKLIQTLSNMHVSVHYQPSSDDSPRSPSDAIALREIASSCLEESEALLEDVGNVLKDLQGGISQKWGSDTRARCRSMVEGRLREEKIERLSNAVTRHTRSIISSRISELGRVVESLQDARQYARPEYESRLDSMARDLEALRLEIQKGRSVDADAKSPEVFTAADVRIFKARLAMLADAEDSLFADKIAASLNYDSRPVRLDSVPQAHKDTFQWAFDSQLSEWFRSGSGTFWISGKPGSGKSTLMKFIARHPQTKELLADWTGSADKLAVATHFFWIAGTPIQKSWLGLLQSLLFDVLPKHPSVAPVISPNRWAAAKAGDWQAAAGPWSITELSAALRALASAGNNIALKMCFFIDGLDEYDSDHTELCKVLQDMASSPHIKICLSSRPWAVFEKSFGGDSKERLDVHELTRNDIRRFVTDQLQAHPGWAIEEFQNASSGKAELVERIAAQSDGVFLWAFFVTRSLREGLSNGDGTSDLHKHLDDLPTDLEQLFERMLERVDPIDHPKMAAILQAATHALEPLHIDLYWQLEMEFEVYEYAYRCPIVARPFDQILEQREQTSRSINEKTKGLLKLVNERVEFLHRTVKDFVSTRDMGLYLRSKLPAEYNGFVSIATAYLGFMKTTRQDHSLVGGIVRQGRGLNSGLFISYLNRALIYASEALKSGQSDHQTTALLEKFETAAEAMVRAGHVTIRGYGSESCNPGLPFREELLKHNLTPYIARKIREQPDFFDIFDEPPLFAALVPMSLSSGEPPAPVPGVLDIILRHGAGDPNVLSWSEASGVSDASSPWMLFVRGTLSFFHMLSKPCIFPAQRFNESLNNGIFDLLLSYGADPNKTLLDRPGAHTAFSHFLDISLSRFLGEECFQGYLRTLDAFLRAGASLGVPSMGRRPTGGPDAEAAFGNLARPRPKETVLVSYCTALKGLSARLAADPERARFVSSVTEKIIFHCSGMEEDLGELSLAISEGCPPHVAEALLALIDEMGRKQGETRKRRRESSGDGSSGSGAKHMGEE